MSRATEEWIGKTDDTPIPPRVKLRVFERHGGENREANLAPALRDKHREKTALDVAEKAGIYRKRAKHLGIAPAKRKWPSRGFDGGPSKKSLRTGGGEG